MADIISEVNVLPKLGTWAAGSSSYPVVWDTVGEDGYSGTYTCSAENMYMQVDIKTSTYMGKRYKLGFTDFSASDGESWLEVRVYHPNAASGDYDTVISAKNVSGPQEYDLTVPASATRIRIRTRHDYAPSIDPPVTIHVAGAYLKEVTTAISYTRLNFHKVLQESLPASVEPGTEHVYYTTDGTRVRMYISTKEGGLIEVTGLNTSDAGGEAKYSNAYTQAHIDERKAEIVELTKQGHCLVFAVATDIHLRIEDGDAGRKNQVRDFLMLTEQLPIDYIICEGDIMSYCQEWDGVFEPRADFVQKTFNQCRCPWYATRGNHDYNDDDNSWESNPLIRQYTADNADQYFIADRDWTRTVVSKLPTAPNHTIHFDRDHPENGYYYVDDHTHKHRIVMCNSEETKETDIGKPYIGDGQVVDAYISGVETKQQIEWLIDHAMNFSDKGEDAGNWVVSFHSHTLPYSDRWIGYAGEDGELGGYKVRNPDVANASMNMTEFHGYGWDNHGLRQLIHAFQFGEQLDFQMGLYDVDDVNDGVTNHSWINYQRNVDFRQQGPMKVLGWFAGHCHDDCHGNVYGLNLAISTCTCASQRTNWSLDATPAKLPPARNSTDLAMSVNVFVVNLDTRQINVVKLGSKRDNSVKASSDYMMTY